MSVERYLGELSEKVKTASSYINNKGEHPKVGWCIPPYLIVFETNIEAKELNKILFMKNHRYSLLDNSLDEKDIYSNNPNNLNDDQWKFKSNNIKEMQQIAMVGMCLDKILIIQ